MKKFWGYDTNGSFSVGCTGQTVYVYDESGNEIGKFKDIRYGYTPMISPDGTLFVVKSTDGRLAVYSPETLSLIKKFRFSKVAGAQDDGFCFSPDGKRFINIERQKDDLHVAVSVYDTVDFALVERVVLSDTVMVEHIEFDGAANAYYVLGFVRGADGVIDHGFVAPFEDDRLENMTALPDKEFDFYRRYKRLEINGFTEKAYEWSYIEHTLDELRSMRLTLADIYRRYNNKASSI